MRQLVVDHGINTDDPKFYNGISARTLLAHTSLCASSHILQDILPVPTEVSKWKHNLLCFCTLLDAPATDSYIAKIQDDLSNQFHYTKRFQSAMQFDEEVFLEPTPTAVIDARIADFSVRTGNDVMRMEICIVCARELQQTTCTRINVTDIPNLALLKPPQSYPSHILSEDMFLYSEHCSPIVGLVFVCDDCLKSMNHDVMLKLALANNLWLGHVPMQLAILNLLQRILITCYFPAGYIVKLYPKIKSAHHWDSDLFASGIKGNVSTYPLPHAHISSFINGRQTMPPATGILSALISVTFIQLNKKVQYPFPKMLHICCHIVFNVLYWLKTNNPLWEGIHIEPDQIASLPEDTVPEEIIRIARVTTDMDVLSMEETGYVA